MIIEMPVMRWALLKRLLDKKNIPYEEERSPLSEKKMSCVRAKVPERHQKELKKTLKLLYENDKDKIAQYTKETYVKRETYVIDGEMELTVDKELAETR